MSALDDVVTKAFGKASEEGTLTGAIFRQRVLDLLADIRKIHSTVDLATLYEALKRADQTLTPDSGKYSNPPRSRE
jgi:hypothetical protein